MGANILTLILSSQLLFLMVNTLSNLHTACGSADVLLENMQLHRVLIKIWKWLDVLALSNNFGLTIAIL